jgi:hypothetical protein
LGKNRIIWEKIGLFGKNRIIWEKNRIIWKKIGLFGKKSDYLGNIRFFGKKTDFLGKKTDFLGNNPIFRLCNIFFFKCLPPRYRVLYQFVRGIVFDNCWIFNLLSMWSICKFSKNFLKHKCGFHHNNWRSFHILIIHFQYFII